MESYIGQDSQDLQDFQEETCVDMEQHHFGDSSHGGRREHGVERGKDRMLAGQKYAAFFSSVFSENSV